MDTTELAPASDTGLSNEDQLPTRSTSTLAERAGIAHLLADRRWVNQAIGVAADVTDSPWARNSGPRHPKGDARSAHRIRTFGPPIDLPAQRGSDESGLMVPVVYRTRYRQLLVEVCRCWDSWRIHF